MAGAYRGLSKRWLDNVGLYPSSNDNINGAAPYWRADYHFNAGSSAAHYFSVGTFGLILNTQPDPAVPDTNRYSDTALEATHQQSAQRAWLGCGLRVPPELECRGRIVRYRRRHRCGALRARSALRQQQWLARYSRLYRAIRARATRKEVLLRPAVGEPARRTSIYGVPALQRRHIPWPGRPRASGHLRLRGEPLAEWGHGPLGLPEAQEVASPIRLGAASAAKITWATR